MKRRTENAKTICATAFALLACVAALTCDAAARAAPPQDTGRPQDLINNPICWTVFSPYSAGRADWIECGRDEVTTRERKIFVAP